MDKINSENYVEHVLRTDCITTQELIHRLTDPDTIRLIHAAMGMVTESAELMDMIKKHIFYGKPLDIVNAIEELGDNQWYVGLAVDVLRTTVNEIMTVNINKLKLRYPEKFNEKDAVDRDVVAERVLLESETESKEFVVGQYINIEEENWKAIKEAASKSKWIPEDYFMNDWVFDVCEYLKNGVETCKPELSQRGKDWIEFSAQVLAHIESYTVPQYGDKGEDEVTNWTVEDCLKAVSKYRSRHGKNSREGQDELDMLKMAHFIQIAFEKYNNVGKEVV